MDNEIVNVIIKEDDSVERQLNKTAKKLHKKYTKKRKINEKLLAEKSPIEKFLSFIFTTFCVIMMILSMALCTNNIISRIQGVNPSIFGYSNMRVGSDSMEPLFMVGDIVVSHTVDTDSLKIGDIIVFYNNPTNSAEFKNLKRQEKITEISDQTLNSTTKYIVPPESLIGIQNEEIKSCAKNTNPLVKNPVIHRIVNIYEDNQGRRWFNTKGDNLLTDDSYRWMICETTVVGIYDTTSAGNTVKVILSTLCEGNRLLICLAIPLVFLTLIVIPYCIKDVQLAMLELDVVEEKRKLTDEICVKNQIGYKMDYETKFKVLATAPDDQKNEYISLLWEEGTAPSSIRKFYARKQINLSSIEKMRDINRECEKMYKDNVPMNKIAKFYLTEKQKIEKEQEHYKKVWKKMRKQYSAKNLKNDMFD